MPNKSKPKLLRAQFDWPPVKQFSELTISEPGWYYFQPRFRRQIGSSLCFILITADTIIDGDLKCRRYTGIYTGPYWVPDDIAYEVHPT